MFLRLNWVAEIRARREKAENPIWFFLLFICFPPSFCFFCFRTMNINEIQSAEIVIFHFASLLAQIEFEIEFARGWKSEVQRVWTNLTIFRHEERKFWTYCWVAESHEGNFLTNTIKCWIISKQLDTNTYKFWIMWRQIVTNTTKRWQISWRHFYTHTLTSWITFKNFALTSTTTKPHGNVLASTHSKKLLNSKKTLNSRS